MKYFLQLLKSYARLHESDSKGQLDPQALQLATGYFNQANSSPAPKIGENSPTLIPVTQIGGNVYKNQDNKVIYDNFPGKLKSRAIAANGSGPSRQNFNDFVKLFSDSSSGGQATGQQPDAQAGVAPLAQDGQNPLAQTQDIEIINGARFSKLIQEICASKDKKADKAMCNYLQLNLHKLTNSRSDSILSSLKKATSIIVACLSSGLSKCKKESDKQSQIHKDAAYKTLQEVSNFLMDTIENKEGKLSVEDIAYLNSRINIQGNQIAIIDRSGNGMLVTQHPDRSQMISSMLKTLVSQVKDENGDPFEFKSDLVNFLSDKGIGPGGAPARGFLFEQLVIASNDFISCQAEKDPEAKRACTRLIHEKFQKYVEGKDNLSEALLSLATSLIQDGEVATTIDDDVSNDFLKEIVLPTLINGGGTEEIQQKLSLAGRVMGALSSLSGLIRKPYKTVDAAKKVGQGRRSDNIEIYKTEEEARNALVRQKLPKELIDEVGIVKVNGGYAIGNGLKWTSSGDDVKAGETSPKSILEAAGKTVNDTIKSWHSAMKKYMGITDKQRKAFSERVAKTEELTSKLQSIKDNIKTRGANKDKITVNQREAAVDMIKKEVLGMIGMDPDDRLVRSVIAEFRKGSLDKEDDWDTTCRLLVNSITKASLRKRLNSSDPKEIESAFDEIQCMSGYAGVASDNTLLSVANGKTGKLHTTVHNIQMRKASERLNKLKEAILSGNEEQKQAALKEIIINDKSINIGKEYKLDADGYSASFHIDKRLFTDPETCTTNSISIARGNEDPSRQDSSRSIDSNQLMKFLMEQRSTLDKMISIIAKGDHN